MTPDGGVAIIGVGHDLPANVDDNETLCRILDVTPEWIVAKTGIKRRFVAGASESASDFGRRAAVRALKMAAVSASQIDLIIACTFSGDYIFPALSAKIHQDIGATGAQTFDLQANCAGFVAGLTVASDRMKADASVRHALVVGVEMNSRYVDRTDVNTAIYVSDGAGAVVLGRTATDRGILASAFHTDSSNYEAVRMRAGGSSFRLLGAAPARDVAFMEINGLATWKQAITHLPPVIRKACGKANVGLGDVDFFVFHQANYNLIEYIVKKMGVGLSRTYTNVQEIGNTGAASVAIALSEATSKGCMKPGDLVVLAAVGAGFNFGASVWRWDLPALGAGQ